jgi:hypothetical protein
MRNLKRIKQHSSETPPIVVGDPHGTPPAWMDDRFLTGAADADWHLTHTADLSISEYVQTQREKVSKSMLGKVRIYLDLRYWIQFRKVRMGCGDTIHAALLTELSDLIKRGIAICPLSMAAIVETYKQTDEHTRRETAKLMDELSGGIVVRAIAGNRQAEFQRLIACIAVPENDLSHPQADAFGPLISCFGDITTKDDTPEMISRGKAMFDGLSRMRFPDLLLAMPELPPSIFSRASSAADKHNRIAESTRTRSTYLERLLAEIESGILSAQRQLHSLFLKLAQGNAEVAQRFSDRLRSILLERFKSGKLKHEFPTFYIPSAIYALTDYKRRLYDPNDFFDHEHATVALQYCNMFLTERKLGTLLTEKKPECLADTFKCNVLFDNDAILAALQAIPRS